MMLGTGDGQVGAGQDLEQLDGRRDCSACRARRRPHTSHRDVAGLEHVGEVAPGRPALIRREGAARLGKRARRPRPLRAGRGWAGARRDGRRGGARPPSRARNGGAPPGQPVGQDLDARLLPGGANPLSRCGLLCLRAVSEVGARQDSARAKATRRPRRLARRLCT